MSEERECNRCLQVKPNEAFNTEQNKRCLECNSKERYCGTCRTNKPIEEFKYKGELYRTCESCIINNETTKICPKCKIDKNIIEFTNPKIGCVVNYCYSCRNTDKGFITLKCETCGKHTRNANKILECCNPQAFKEYFTKRNAILKTTRDRIYKALKHNNIHPELEEAIGGTVEDLKKHLNKQFTPEMEAVENFRLFKWTSLYGKVWKMTYDKDYLAIEKALNYKNLVVIPYKNNSTDKKKAEAAEYREKNKNKYKCQQCEYSTYLKPRLETHIHKIHKTL
jgi:hypothetical protein